MKKIEDHVIGILKKNNIDDAKLEVPPNPEMGDYAFGCFLLSKELKKPPFEIAKELGEKIGSDNIIQKTEVKGPYLNFFIDRNYFLKNINRGNAEENAEKILIEYPSPNTNKSLHVGHVRNLLLGNSLSRILKRCGHDVVKTNLNNDRGIAICKAMIAYKEFGEGKTPDSEGMKPDKFAEKFYILFGKKAEEDKILEKKAQELLVLWEKGDKDTIGLWKKFLSWVSKGYEETFRDYKFSTDKNYYESDIYDKGKNIVLDALEKNAEGFGKEDDGAVFVDLEDKKLGKKYLLRGDGTTLYMTQDLYLAKMKEEEFNADRYVFIVGSEQKYHFEVLFEILDRLGYGGSDKNHHFAYGYVYDKDGKKFSSRKGKTFGADELLSMVREKSIEVLKEKHPDLNKKEIEERSRVIGYSALAFSFLKINPLSDISFDVDNALSFEGETGPYVQYAYARIMSILRKADVKGVKPKDFKDITDKEYELAKKIDEFSVAVHDAGRQYKPSLIARYLLDLVKVFSSFYSDHQVIGEEKGILEKRIFLIENTARIIKEGLDLLDIEVLDRM